MLLEISQVLKLQWSEQIVSTPRIGVDEDKEFILKLRQWFWISEQLSNSAALSRSGGGLELYLMAVSLEGTSDI